MFTENVIAVKGRQKKWTQSEVFNFNFKKVQKNIINNKIR